MIVGYLSGVFDLFHIGHLNIIRNAKENCDYLIVGVSTDELCLKYKGHKPTIPFEERIAIVESVKYVDRAIKQETLEKNEIVKEYNVDMIFHGDDEKNLDLYKKIENSVQCYGTRVKLLPYTSHISSTIINNKVFEKFFYYRSLYDMDCLIRQCCKKIPTDIDFIVGVPKSGIIAASIIATLLNIPLLGYEAILLNGNVDTCINDKRWKKTGKYISNQKYNVLLVDDSVHNGTAICKVKEMLLMANPRLVITTLGIYATHGAAEGKIDLYFERLNQPRVFEWNIQHNRILANSIISASMLFSLESLLGEREIFFKKIGVIYNDVEISNEELALRLKKRNIEGDLCDSSKKLSEVYVEREELLLAIVAHDDQALEIHYDTLKPVLAFYSAQLYG